MGFKSRRTSEHLGEISCASGTLVVVDMGLLGAWTPEHGERVDRAVRGDRRTGVVRFAGVWAVAVGGLPPNMLRVCGTRVRVGRYRDCWHHVEVRVRAGDVAATEPAGDVGVDWARLAFADAASLGEWTHETALDGKSDFVFWGRDAAAIAQATAAPDLGNGQYGWIGRPIAQAVELGIAVERYRDAGSFVLGTDFRPHSHHYSMMEQVRASETESGTLDIGDSKMCAFMTTWGDGVFPVELDRDAKGDVLSVRVVLATPEALANMDAVNM
jgi:hypothetical protein